MKFHHKEYASQLHSLKLSLPEIISKESAIPSEIKENMIFWQCLVDQLIVSFNKSCVKKRCNDIRILTKVEENALRYTGGYIIRKVINCFKRKKICIDPLLALLLHDDDLLEEMSLIDYTTAWIQKTDRGGLYHISRTCFEFFCEVEITTYNLLKELFTGNGDHTAADIEDVAMKDPDVIRIWEICSLDMTSSEAHEALKLIIHFWVMTRGSSLTKQYMEEYKASKKKVTKSKSLRKEMKK